MRDVHGIGAYTAVFKKHPGIRIADLSTNKVFRTSSAEVAMVVGS